MAQAPMRADEAITSTRPNAIRFPRRSRETVQAVQSRYRLKPTRFGSRGDHVRPWPDAEPTRIVTQRAKTSNPPPDRYDLAPRMAQDAFF